MNNVDRNPPSVVYHGMVELLRGGAGEGGGAEELRPLLPPGCLYSALVSPGYVVGVHSHGDCAALLDEAGLNAAYLCVVAAGTPPTCPCLFRTQAPVCDDGLAAWQPQQAPPHVRFWTLPRPYHDEMQDLVFTEHKNPTWACLPPPVGGGAGNEPMRTEVYVTLVGGCNQPAVQAQCVCCV